MATTTRGSGDFSIGARVWPGLGKVIEESGEVAQVIGKLFATDGEDRYYDGSDLRSDLSGELGDLLAAIDYVRAYNKLDEGLIHARRARKLYLFAEWHSKGGGA